MTMAHNDTPGLLLKAKEQMLEDMKTREIGAIIWSVPDAGFHYIPEIMVTSQREDMAGVSIDEFYRPGIDVPPVVVTLSEMKASEQFGTPSEAKGFTTQGSLEEWVAIADCYFEALAES